MNSTEPLSDTKFSRSAGITASCASVLIAYYVISQWFPYAENIYNTNTDWSQVKDAGLEPWDGTLLGMYLFTAFGWVLLGLTSGWAAARIRRKTGRRLDAMLYAGAIAVVPIAVSVWFASK